MVTCLPLLNAGAPQESMDVIGGPETAYYSASYSSQYASSRH